MLLRCEGQRPELTRLIRFHQVRVTAISRNRAGGVGAKTLCLKKRNRGSGSQHPFDSLAAVHAFGGVHIKVLHNPQFLMVALPTRRAEDSAALPKTVIIVL